MIELLCPKCGAKLNQYVITSYPPINMTSCPSCGWKDETREPIIQAVYSKPKPQTNADRIRGMSDEELAEWMAINTDCFFCKVKDKNICSLDEGTCTEEWLFWLKSPVNLEAGK